MLNRSFTSGTKSVTFKPKLKQHKTGCSLKPWLLGTMPWNWVIDALQQRDIRGPWALRVVDDSSLMSSFCCKWCQFLPLYVSTAILWKWLHMLALRWSKRHHQWEEERLENIKDITEEKLQTCSFLMRCPLWACSDRDMPKETRKALPEAKNLPVFWATST